MPEKVTYEWFYSKLVEKIQLYPDGLRRAYIEVKGENVNDPDAAYILFFIARELFAEKILNRQSEIGPEIQNFTRIKKLLENCFKVDEWSIEFLTDNTVNTPSEILAFWEAVEIFLTNVISEMVLSVHTEAK